ncbi:hypothetical protein HXX76_011651 [Chlamydomonas incerta]|uniref:Intradiol ring-cleavage dioxygenases domain-containing protein n=1 Tax=Chlamydomonas incerta TaxID=51695 RepID=A0A835SC46_CHLIN|nr:hypothetical protein HXX76_011651 [Chlamydomonas incerta]|eukprot:KAG2422836.1 hypothetical protein HXX76_011651 [Chlamydomonas incerta]
MELQQQQLQQQQQQLLVGSAVPGVELASLAAAPSSAESVAEDSTATRGAALVRAAAAKPARAAPRRNRRSPPRPPPRAGASPALAPAPSPKPSPSTSEPSPRPSPSPSPSPSPAPRSCIATTPDVLGPYYQSQGVPINTQPDESFCALKAGGRNATRITITGHVLQSFTCTPVTGGSALTFIDVWQANNAGEYDNNQDVSDSECRTRVPIGADGSYKYSTIIPAAYGSRTCLRPPHIHLRVALPGYAILVTQMYFAGNPLNGPNDCGCSSCGSGNPAQQVALDPASGAGVFDIVINRQR